MTDQIKQTCEALLKEIKAPFPSKEAAIAAGCCVFCGEPVADRIYSEAGQGEYQLSGSCEICFDKLFEGTEEGETCGRKGCAGIIDTIKEGSCSCHINPPCHVCTSARPYCPICGWEGERP
jgi:hypothetical protein